MELDEVSACYDAVDVDVFIAVSLIASQLKGS
jgi:hypothetical protein